MEKNRARRSEAASSKGDPVMTMRVAGLLEAAIYGSDLEALERFYVDLFGLEPVQRTPGRNTALRCGASVVILFDPTVTLEQGHRIPPHGTSGPGHIAFVVPPDDLPAWRERIREFGITPDGEVAWPDGGVSIYMRDPAGNSVELAPPSLWGGVGYPLLELDVR